MPAALAIGALGSAAVGASSARSAARSQQRAADRATQAQQDQYNQTRDDLSPFRDIGTSAMRAYAAELGLIDPSEVFGTPAPANAPAAPAAAGLGPRPVFTGTQESFNAIRDFNRTSPAPAQVAQPATIAGTQGRTYGGYETSPMARYLLEKNTGTINAAFAARGGFNSGAALKALEDDRMRVVSADRNSYLDRLANLGTAGQNAASQTGQFGMQSAANIGQLQLASGQAQAQGQLGVGQAIQSGIGDIAGIYGYFSNPMAAFASSPNSFAPTSSPRPMMRPFR